MSKPDGSKIGVKFTDFLKDTLDEVMEYRSYKFYRWEFLPDVYAEQCQINLIEMLYNGNHVHPIGTISTNLINGPNVFDGEIDTFAYGYNAPYEVIIELSTPQKLDAWSWFVEGESKPRKYKLFGSDDGADWDLLDYGESGLYDGWHDFNIPSPSQGSAFVVKGVEPEMGTRGEPVERQYHVGKLEKHPTEERSILLTILRDQYFDSVSGDLTVKFDPEKSTLEGDFSSKKPEIFDVDFGPEELQPSYKAWIVETIREGKNLTDTAIAIKQEKAYGPPESLCNVYVQGGTVKLATLEYNEHLRNEWVEEFDVGEGIACAVAYDGNWVLYRQRWRMVTEGEPYIFWASSNGDMFVQVGDNESTRLQLASDVVKVKAMRGWKNINFPERDTGIIALYIKDDGEVYYRNFCYQELSGVYAWEGEREVEEFTGTAVNINLFITNDYRTGIIIEDDLGKINWLITERNWAGMASPMEFISVWVKDIDITVYEVGYFDVYDDDDEHLDVSLTDIWLNPATPIYPEPIHAENTGDSDVLILLKFNHEIDYDLSMVSSAFVIKDSLNTEFGIVSTQAGDDNSEIIFNMNSFGGSTGDMTITYDRTVIELDCLNENSRFEIESFDFGFTPKLTVPEGYGYENIQFGLLIDFVPKEVSHISASSSRSENITIGIVDVSIVVTKVGDNPL